MRKFTVFILVLLFAFLTMVGCMAAEKGCKKISGGAPQSAVFSLTRREREAELTLFGGTVNLPLF